MVDRNGYVIERFIGLKHVTSTTIISLKEAIDQLFSKHGLSMLGCASKVMMGLPTCKASSIVLKHLLLMRMGAIIVYIVFLINYS